MKKLIIVFFVLTGVFLQAQNREILEEAPSFTWFGLDFTHAKLIGTDVDFSEPDRIVNDFFGKWNQLFIDEPKKYDLSKAFKTSVYNDISIAGELNKKVDPETLLLENPNTISLTEVEEIIKNYTGKEGIGLSFIVENLDKPALKVRYWVVLFDISTHNILLAEKLENEVTGGFGFRNYWASGIYSGIKTIKKQYPKWLKSLNK